MYDAFGECDIDIADRVVRSLSGGRELSDDDVDCLRNSLDEDLVRELVVTSFVDGDSSFLRDEELVGRLEQAFSAVPGAISG